MKGTPDKEDVITAFIWAGSPLSGDQSHIGSPVHAAHVYLLVPAYPVIARQLSNNKILSQHQNEQSICMEVHSHHQKTPAYWNTLSDTWLDMRCVLLCLFNNSLLIHLCWNLYPLFRHESYIRDSRILHSHTYSMIELSSNGSNVTSNQRNPDLLLVATIHHTNCCTYCHWNQSNQLERIQFLCM